MRHLDEAVLVALRDGALEGAEQTRADDHLADCRRCRERAAEIEGRRSLIEAALHALDEDFDAEAARAAVRARVAGTRADEGVVPLRADTPRKRAAQGWWSLSRAAGLVLVAATAASALPGSPVRGWIEDALGSDESGTASVESAEPGGEATTATLAGEGTGIRLSVPDGPLRVEIDGLPAGAEVAVRWMPGSEVAVLAPQGSAFSSSEGRVTATVGSGPVEVQLPRGVRPAVIEVGGRTYLRSTTEGVEVPGPSVERTDRMVRFRVPPP